MSTQTITEPRYQVAKVEAADGNTWAVFDMTGDAYTPAGIVDRYVFRRVAELSAAALEKLWLGIQETWPACEYIDCNEPSAAGSEFCAEHQAEHEENMRLSAENGRRAREEPRYQIKLHGAVPNGQSYDLEDAVQMALNHMHNGFSVRILSATGGTVWDSATGKPLPTAAEAAAPACDCGRGNPMLQGDGTPDLCQDCVDEGRGINETCPTDSPRPIGEALDEALVTCLERTVHEATCALGIDRFEDDAVERLGACLDAIGRLQRAAERHLKELAELR